MTFRPTFLPFQLQALGTTGVWRNHCDGAFATLEDAKFVVAALYRDAPSGGPYRVHCDPDTVAQAFLEAHRAIELHRREAKFAIGNSMRGEACKERGQANQRSEEEPDPDSDGR